MNSKILIVTGVLVVLFLSVGIISLVQAIQMNGEPCTQSTECQSYLCEDNICVCRGAGADCVLDRHCCNGVCIPNEEGVLNGTCSQLGQSAGCQAGGETCAIDNDCCSKMCGSNWTCFAEEPDLECPVPDDVCISGPCQKDTEGNCQCQFNFGASCTAESSKACINGRCAGGFSDGECRGAFEICRVNNDCCVGICGDEGYCTSQDGGTGDTQPGDGSTSDPAPPVVINQGCRSCGDGVFNLCDKEECLSLGSCVFLKKNNYLLKANKCFDETKATFKVIDLNRQEPIPGVLVEIQGTGALSDFKASCTTADSGVCPIGLVTSGFYNVYLRSNRYTDKSGGVYKMEINPRIPPFVFTLYPIDSQCQDSDPNNDYYIEGRVSDKTGLYRDNCSGNNLIQYQCLNNQVVATPQYQCLNGCKEGACRQLLGDSGKASFIIKDTAGKIVPAVRVIVERQAGATMGACISDYNGLCSMTLPYGDFKAIVRGDPLNQCSADFDCPKLFTISKGDSLVPIILKRINVQADYCYDLDGGLDYYKKSATRDSHYQGSIINEMFDNCSSDGKELREYFCDGHIIDKQKYICPNGCADGACLGKEPVVQKCVDSDVSSEFADGENYQVKGTATDSAGSYSDYCSVGGVYQYEYYCIKDDQVGRISQRCPDNKPCKNGVCGGEEEVKPNSVAVTFQVLDSATGELISDSQIDVLLNSEKRGQCLTKNGSCSISFNQSEELIVFAQKEGFKPSFKRFNPLTQTAIIKIYLEKKQEQTCICTGQYDPVCGKDGITYSNSCKAGCANVQINYAGECKTGTELGLGQGLVTKEQGGEVSVVANGNLASLEMPPGATQQDIVASIEPISVSDPSFKQQAVILRAGQQIVGSYVYNYSAKNSLTNQSIGQFSLKVAVVISYKDSEIADFDEETVVISYWDGSQWQALPTTLDKDNNMAVAYTDHFTVFRIDASTHIKVLGTDREIVEPSLAGQKGQYCCNTGIDGYQWDGDLGKQGCDVNAGLTCLCAPDQECLVENVLGENGDHLKDKDGNDIRKRVVGKVGICGTASTQPICPPPFGSIEELIKRIIDWIFYLSLIAAPLIILAGAFVLTTAAGDPMKATKAKAIIIWASVGLGIVLAAKIIFSVITGLLLT